MNAKPPAPAAGTARRAALDVVKAAASAVDDIAFTVGATAMAALFKAGSDIFDHVSWWWILSLVWLHFGVVGVLTARAAIRAVRS
jgi:hypothetical protein